MRVFVCLCERTYLETLLTMQKLFLSSFSLSLVHDKKLSPLSQTTKLYNNIKYSYIHVSVHVS